MLLFCLFIFEDLQLRGKQSRHAEVSSLLALGQALLHKCPGSSWVWRKRLCSLLSRGCQTSHFILPRWGSPAAPCGSLARHGQSLEGDTRLLFRLQEGFGFGRREPVVNTIKIPHANFKCRGHGIIWRCSSRWGSTSPCPSARGFGRAAPGPDSHLACD